jgi:2-polyprenyl-3-methyl-5-hydroxy-6-metoxy-1,4-benzoquinol methylase
MTIELGAEPLAALDQFRHDRLPHVLPDFTRISWVSDRARAVWEPRIASIGAAWAALEWRSIAAGIRPCALTSIPAEQLVARSGEWAAHGLSTMPVALSGTSGGYASTAVTARVGEPFEYRVALGSLADVAALKLAIDAGDDSTMGRLLGFPPCCIAFFRHTWVEDGCVDTTWAMAARSTRHDPAQRMLEIARDAPFQANILWRWMGVRAVPHLPCSFACAATVDFANTLLALGRDLGYRTEIEWLEEILEWPVSWSALHGIAEVKTPVLKASTRTDATRHEFIVRWPGRRVPDEGAAGLGFPFRSPARPGVTHSLAFRRGLDAPIAPSSPPPDWYASDNGFNSRIAMDEAHRPIVELARASVGDEGSVIDLGCGNGALLKKITEGRPGLLAFGVDTDAQKLSHARLLLPESGAHFVAGNMFDGVPLDADTVYNLALLMPGRLLEVDEAAARRLREWLRGHFHHLLVYAYGEWLTRHNGLSGLAARAGLTLDSIHESGTAGLAHIAG